MSDYPPCVYRVSAKAAIVTNGKLVLVKEDSEEWDLPGGGVEHREALEDAVRREVKEEVNVDLDNVDTAQMQPWITYDDESDRALLFLVYPAKISQPVNIGMFGDVEIGLFTRDELETIPLVKPIEQYRAAMIELFEAAVAR